MFWLRTNFPNDCVALPSNTLTFWCFEVLGGRLKTNLTVTMMIAISPIASSLGGAEIKDLCVHGGQNVLKLASSFYTGVLKRKMYLNVKRPIL